MTNERIRDGESFKARWALQVEEGDETVSRLVARCEVHPCQNWIKMKNLTQGDAGSLTTVMDRAPGAKKAPRYRCSISGSAN